MLWVVTGRRRVRAVNKVLFTRNPLTHYNWPSAPGVCLSYTTPSPASIACWRWNDWKQKCGTHAFPNVTYRLFIPVHVNPLTKYSNRTRCSSIFFAFHTAGYCLAFASLITHTCSTF